MVKSLAVVAASASEMRRIKSTDDSDPAWRALLSLVYATGMMPPETTSIVPQTLGQTRCQDCLDSAQEHAMSRIPRALRQKVLSRASLPSPKSSQCVGSL